jgi:hypothetical protein
MADSQAELGCGSDTRNDEVHPRCRSTASSVIGMDNDNNNNNNKNQKVVGHEQLN